LVCHYPIANFPVIARNGQLRYPRCSCNNFRATAPDKATADGKDPDGPRDRGPSCDFSVASAMKNPTQAADAWLQQCRASSVTVLEFACGVAPDFRRGRVGSGRAFGAPPPIKSRSHAGRSHTARIAPRAQRLRGMHPDYPPASAGPKTAEVIGRQLCRRSR